MDKTLKKIEPLIESYWDSMTDTEQTIAHFLSLIPQKKM